MPSTVVGTRPPAARTPPRTRPRAPGNRRGDPMQYRQLGRTGIRVSEMGFGAWGIGKAMWLGAEDDRSVAALHAALDAGCTFIDTALAYGNGHSERLVAKA